MKNFSDIKVLFILLFYNQKNEILILMILKKMIKKWVIIATFFFVPLKVQAIPACDGIDLAELKEKFLKEVHNEQEYKAFKPYKWKICARTLGTTLYKENKEKADKAKEGKAEADNSDEDKNKPDENQEESKKEDENKPDKNKFSAVETDIANHYLHRIYPNYPLP